MIKITSDSSIVFHLLENHFKSSFKLNENQTFILSEPVLRVIFYQKLTKSETLTCFEVENETNSSISAHQLLVYFDQDSKNGNALAQQATDLLHDFLLQLKSNPLFFDAH